MTCFLFMQFCFFESIHHSYTYLSKIQIWPSHYLNSFMVPWHLQQGIQSCLWLSPCLSIMVFGLVLSEQHSFFYRTASPIITVWLLQKYQLETRLWLLKFFPWIYQMGIRGNAFFPQPLNSLSVWEAWDIEPGGEPRWETKWKNPYGTEPDFWSLRFPECSKSLQLFL